MRKDAVITVRVPRPTRRRLEVLARREGRSLSQQVERLIERGLASDETSAAAPSRASRLEGLLTGEPVPDFGDFRAVRTVLSSSIQPGRRRGHLRR
jgi:predicted DNA-binding protein